MGMITVTKLLSFDATMETVVCLGLDIHMTSGTDTVPAAEHYA